MQITLDNLDSFLRSMGKRQPSLLQPGAAIDFRMQGHYPEDRLIEVGGEIYPSPAIGETLALQIGICPEVKF